MIFLFKKLNTKNLTLMSIIRLFDKQVQLKHNDYQSIEMLDISKQNKIYGYFSIMNYLSTKSRNAIQQEWLHWLAFQMQEKLTINMHDGTTHIKRVIKNENLKQLNKIVEQNGYLEGDSFSEADVLAYFKLTRSVQDLKSYNHLNTWMKQTGAKVEPIVKQLQSEFPNAVKKDNKEKENKQDNKKQDNKKQDNKKQDKKQDNKEKPQSQPQAQKQAKQQKDKEEIPQEYLDQLNKQKINRTNKDQVILPEKGKKNILITSALPYVNNIPHLGNLIGCVLSADVFARYARLRGHNAIYVCGTDEYGTATEVKALQEGCTPQEICTKYHNIHKEIYEWFDIDFDIFGRTSTPIHTEITQDIFKHIHPEYTTQKVKPQTYCKKCDFFLADRYVTGTCPHCKYEDARGDQCDNCQKLLDPVDLVNSKCSICKSTPEVRDTKHIYINLPKIQPTLEKWFNETSHNWSDNSVQISRAWLHQGLQERCITRDLKWGTPVPLEEYNKEVFYVWFDAPIGYISITGNLTQEWKQWWINNDKDVQLYQFMGKDNVPFHTVIFPSTLIATNQNYTLLHNISTTDYLNYEDGKFSKSRGMGVFGDNVKDTGIPSEIFRYYLLINRPEKADSLFTWNDFGVKNNNELLPNLGNLVNRALKFVYKNYNKQVPQLFQLTQNDNQFIDLIMQKFKQEYIPLLEKVELKEGLKKIMEISSLVNKYLQDEKAWEKEQLQSKRSDTILFVALNCIRLISCILEPYMPSLSAKINFLLGFEQRTKQDDNLIGYLCDQPNSALLKLVKEQQKLQLPVPLFRTCIQF